ncbi:endonuclease NucS domain-containing protein [Streptococcus suis]|nr:endonuclease NucS [Streptococcus suis]MDG3228655.1 endonuclease NucS [Streptococcus suis]HEM6492439.1 DUF91 domain-containing protein [Streptococcus suis]
MTATLGEEQEFCSFEELFLWVAKKKQNCNSQQIKKLRSYIKAKYLNKFEGTIYLIDFLDLEFIYALECEHSRENREKEMQNYICKNFKKLFPNFEFVKSEFVIKSGRIDILAEDKNSKRPVIIELKADNKNPTIQLLAYSKEFIEPILIGVTEKKISDSKMDNDITYYVIEDKELREVIK